MMSYNSRPPGSRQLQQPSLVKQHSSVRLDNDEMESFYGNNSKSDSINNNCNNNINITAPRRSIDASSCHGSSHQVGNDSDNQLIGDTINEINPVRKKWLKAFELIRSQLPSVSLCFILFFFNFNLLVTKKDKKTLITIKNLT